MAEQVSTLLVSLLPRADACGSSALAALDAASLELVAEREFPAEEFLRDPESGAPGRIRHCRGIAQTDETLLAALFNGVREYAVGDPRALRLEPGRLLSHPRAADLHGITAAGGILAGASTGSDSVVEWDLGTGEAVLRRLRETGSCEVRFPDRLALEAGCSDWRKVLDSNLHVNGVARRSDGSLLACSLSRVLRLAGGAVETVVFDAGSRMHDGILGDGEDVLLLTDAARGALVYLDLQSGARRFVPVADPDSWFVRGLAVADGHAFVLRSQICDCHQRDPRPDKSCEPVRRGARFGVSVIDLAASALVEEASVEVPEIARGSVAYTLIPWREKGVL